MKTYEAFVKMLAITRGFYSAGEPTMLRQSKREETEEVLDIIERELQVKIEPDQMSYTEILMQSQLGINYITERRFTLPMNQEMKYAIMKGLEGEPETIRRIAEQKLNEILRMLEKRKICWDIEELAKALPDLNMRISSFDHKDVNIHVLLEDIKEDMKEPLKLLANKGYKLEKFDPSENSLTWQLTNGIYIIGGLKGSKCKWVQEGTKEVPNMILKCD